MASATAIALVLSACAVSPSPLTPEERQARRITDQALITANLAIPAQGIDLYQAMALALRYNLAHRQRMLDAAIASGVASVESYDMLPQVAASAGWTHRTNDNATVSRDLETGVVDESPSISVDRTRKTADLTLTWNVLDFGVSYLRAKQNADKILIAQEKQRKAVQTILRDVTSAWLRAVVAERLNESLVPLTARVETALERARVIEEQRLMEPLQALEAQRQLLDILRQLRSLREEVVGARAELASLMNIPPGTPYRLVRPPELKAVPAVREDLQTLVSRALVDRPELRQEDYQTRISEDETTKAILRLLPGIDLNLGGHYDDNPYLVNTTWADAGMFLAWNLMNLVTGPSRIAVAQQREEATTLRRLALHMTVMAQVNVAWVRFQLAQDSLDLADRVKAVDDRIFGHTEAAAETETQSEIELIRRDAARLTSSMRRDLAFVGLEEALSDLRVSVGEDPMPVLDAAASVEDLAAALRDWHESRHSGASSQTFGTGGVTPARGDGFGAGAARVDWTVTTPDGTRVEAAATPPPPAPTVGAGAARVDWTVTTPDGTRVEAAATPPPPAPAVGAGAARVDWIIETPAGQRRESSGAPAPVATPPRPATPTAAPASTPAPGPIPRSAPAVVDWIIQESRLHQAPTRPAATRPAAICPAAICPDDLPCGLASPQESASCRPAAFG